MDADGKPNWDSSALLKELVLMANIFIDAVKQLHNVRQRILPLV